MLENVDLSKKVDRDTYKVRMASLSERLYFVQQRAWEEGVPVVIIFDGWDAAGKGTTIHKLTAPIDPRGYKIYPIRAARTYEKKHPWLWRFWLKIPARGEWAIFDRSWYGRVLVERMEKLVPKQDWERGYQDIVDFERNLADDGVLILKFFLHISKKEQDKRFRKLEGDLLNAWRVTKEDWRNHKRYKKWLKVYQEMIERTDTEWGPWTVVEATNKRYTWLKVYETVVEALEARLGPMPEEPAEAAVQAAPAGLAATQAVAAQTVITAGPGDMAPLEQSSSAPAATHTPEQHAVDQAQDVLPDDDGEPEEATHA